MDDADSTCWQLLDRVDAGRTTAQFVFFERYSRHARDYLRRRWSGSPLLQEVEGAVSQIVEECLQADGPLKAVDRTRSFRPYFVGIVRNHARRFEERAAKRSPHLGIELEAFEANDTSATQALQRSWARRLIERAGIRYRELARDGDEALARRFELLRLRFEEGLPIRAIAVRWNACADVLHAEFRRARAEFRAILAKEAALSGIAGEGQLLGELLDAFRD